jgi:hypothetical protein
LWVGIRGVLPGFAVNAGQVLGLLLGDLRAGRGASSDWGRDVTPVLPPLVTVTVIAIALTTQAALETTPPAS